MNATDTPAIDIKGRLWLTVGEHNFGGHGRIVLLKAIRDHGSIMAAARSMKMSYKAAWDAVDAMNNLAGEALVERHTGGKGGGSTRLTARGERLIEHFDHLEVLHEQFLLSLAGQGMDGDEEGWSMLRKLAMKTSADNEYSARVVSVREGAVNDEIEMEIIGARSLVATMTRESRVRLGLKPGVEVFAFVQASAVVLVAEENPIVSARNRWRGVVARLETGAVNSQVVVELPDGGSVVAIVTNDSIEQLHLEPEAPVWAIFKASSVILAV